MSFSRKNYRLTSDAEKSRVTGKGWQAREKAPYVEGKRRKRQRQQSSRSSDPRVGLHPLCLPASSSPPAAMERCPQEDCSSHPCGRPTTRSLWGPQS